MLLATRKQILQYLFVDAQGQFYAIYNGLRVSSVFQPIFDKHLNVVGVEALARIHTLTGECMMPDTIFLGEETNTEDKINLECLSRVVHIRNYSLSTYRNVALFINMLPAASERYAYTDIECTLLAKRLKELQIDASNIVMEIIEAKSESDDLLQNALQRMHEYGFNIAIDDYGVEESNEYRLNLLNPQIVKLDRSLMQDYVNGTQSPLLNALTTIRNKGAKIVVEGIETEAQFNAMRGLNVDMLQGYYLAEPQAIVQGLQHVG